MREVTVPVRPGDVIDGKYRVESILGKGGMGAVVRAKHEALGRSVAIKLLLPDMMQSSGRVQRFEREARAAARLKSDHVIDVMDVGRLPSGEPFIVMELLEGQDLAAHLNARGRGLSVEETLDIILQVCDGVGEAHAAGIVHRDLKPHNIFLTPRRDGRLHVKVLDFGISKVHGDVEGALTGSQEMLGSPYYMSPEQLLSTRDVGPSADVWALGVILYQLLAGHVPFRGDTLAAITNGICSHPHPPLGTVCKDVPPWLTTVVEHCLRKDPAGRMRSVDALSEVLRSRGESATMPAYTPQEGIRQAPALLDAMQIDAMQTAASTNAVVAVITPRTPPPHPSSPLGGTTNVGWGTSTSPKKSGGNAGWVAFGVVVIALLVGGGIAVRRSGWGRSAPSTMPKASEVTPAPPPSPAPAPVASSSPVTASQPAPPRFVAAPSATMSAKPPRQNRPATKPTATGDDLPSLRK